MSGEGLNGAKKFLWTLAGIAFLQLLALIGGAAKLGADVASLKTTIEALQQDHRAFSEQIRDLEIAVEGDGARHDTRLQDLDRRVTRLEERLP